MRVPCLFLCCSEQLDDILKKDVVFMQEGQQRKARCVIKVNIIFSYVLGLCRIRHHHVNLDLQQSKLLTHCI